MLVDNPLYQQSYFSSGSSYPEYPTDLNDIFDTELFNNTFATGSSINSSTPSGSRGSTPQNLLTPPQGELLTSFPEIHDEESANHGLFTIFEDDLKTIDPLSISTSSNDFMSSIDNMYGSGSVSGYGIDMSGYGGMPMDLSSMGVGIDLMGDSMQAHGIDPQLVDTPSAVSDNGEDESDEKESPPSPVVVEKETEKPTIIIAPVKVGGHGKARKGTVQSGGVVKKSASSSASREKENSTATFSSSSSSSTKKAAAQTKATTSSGLFNAGSTSGSFLKSGGSANADSEAGDAEDEDDLPQDWRPSPEVFAKMTSKEKRQLRNKISARNFRVRRKEYISSLEGDIAERDRMLDHFRTQLGSTESENHALRQEIAALKKALLDGRSGPINLPPPAPLPEQSAAEALAASASSSITAASTSLPLLTANTQKDLPTSPRMGNRFWGGVGIGGGFTPVHTTLVPDISTFVKKGVQENADISIGTLTRMGLQENMNPAMNAQPQLGGAGLGATKGLGGFDGFSDLNPFTMKTLDAYRMHLWGKMAAQQHMHQQSQQAHHHLSSSTTSNSGLASNLRPLYFSASNKPNLPSASAYGGSALSALLSGKHNVSSYSYSPPSSSSSLPGSSVLGPKGSAKDQQREKEQQQAMLAAMASQTVFRKLGSAFWDAFTGSSSSSSSPLSASPPSPYYHHPGNWDQDKVQRVLEGKAVLRVVDVEPPATAAAAPPTTSVVSAPTPASPRMSCKRPDDGAVKRCAAKAAVCDILEESMRSLTLGKGV